MNLKKIGKVFTSKSVGTGHSSYEKRIYRAAVSQRLRNTDVSYYNLKLFKETEDDNNNNNLPPAAFPRDQKHWSPTFVTLLHKNTHRFVYKAEFA